MMFGLTLLSGVLAVLSLWRFSAKQENTDTPTGFIVPLLLSLVFVLALYAYVQESDEADAERTRQAIQATPRPVWELK